jgi:hypothetical protein
MLLNISVRTSKARRPMKKSSVLAKQKSGDNIPIKRTPILGFFLSVIERKNKSSIWC